MKVPEQSIRECAFARISEIFHIPVEQLRDDTVFGVDLKCSFVSRLQENEYDNILDDIRDVAGRKITKELNNGFLTIHTVGDYCAHMMRCYETMPERVSRILRLPKE